MRRHLTLVFRSMRRQAVYTAVNLAGLAVGLAGGLLLFLFVRDELSYDRFHAHANRIFRVYAVERVERTFQEWARVSALLGPAMAERLPEVEHAVRLYRPDRKVAVRHGDRVFLESRLFYADPAFFDVFSFPLVAGDPRAVLREPGTVVLTPEAARRYFGAADPLGRVLVLDGATPLTVAGVVAPAPPQSHLHFDLLVSFATLPASDAFYLYPSHTYVRLPAHGAAQRVEARLAAMLEVPGWWQEAGVGALRLQPLTRIHLHSDLFEEIEPNGDVRYVYVFSAVALLLLAVACINYTNLATARSAQRAREVGVRKTLGAGRLRLAGQFVGEAIVHTGVALVLAVAAVELALPAFNRFTGKTLGLAFGADPWLLPALLGAGLLTALAAGAYPALYLSAAWPVAVLKGKLPGGPAHARLREALVVVQFTASVALIAGTLVVWRQVDYLHARPLGYDREHVVVLPVRGDLPQRYEAMKAALRRHPGVVRVAAASGAPNAPEIGRLEAGGAPYDVHYLLVDPDYVETMGMTLVAGRGFETGAGRSAAVLLNEAAVRRLGWTDAVGRTFAGLLGEAEVVGVVADFHTLPLHERIHPTVLQVAPAFFDELVVRIRPEGVRETLAFLEAQWKAFVPGRPFEYTFLDDTFATLYQREERLGRMVAVFALLTVFVAALGLFGLAAYTAEQRTKEIGIRKVLGASVPGLVLMLAGSFVRLVLASVVLAAPVAYLAVAWWLDHFAYRVEVGWAVFAWSGLTAVAVALATVGWQAARAALADPARSLRYE